MLDDKVAVIYGAGGSIGGAVARTFASEGARVFFAGRTETTLDEVAAEGGNLARAATLADVGDVAAFVASERARTITATEVNISCGAIME